MTVARDHLTKGDAVTVAAIEAGVPALAVARDLTARFQSMIRRKAVAELDPWIAHAATNLVASFAVVIAKDRRAITAVITEQWSNGQTEGHTTRLKLVKRQMFGRAKLDLLKARLLGAT